MAHKRTPLNSKRVSISDSERSMPIRMAPPAFEGTEQAFRSCAGKLARMVRCFLRNPVDVEDIAQQTFVNALAHLDSFRADSAPRTRLTRIAFNEALMARKRDRSAKCVPIEQARDGQMRVILLQLIDSLLNPEENFQERERGALIDDSLGSLSPGFRAVVVLHHLKDLNCEQTAAWPGISLSATKSRLLRARWNEASQKALNMYET